MKLKAFLQTFIKLIAGLWSRVLSCPSYKFLSFTIEIITQAKLLIKKCNSTETGNVKYYCYHPILVIY